MGYRLNAEDRVGYYPHGRKRHVLNAEALTGLTTEDGLPPLSD